MAMKIGCDLVEIKRFKKSLRRGGQKFLERIFTPRELSNSPKAETLAGIFAAKEAVTKALELPAGNWHKLEISKDQKGRPAVKILKSNKKIISQDISISHDGEYAIAVAFFYVTH